ncbi:subtype B tannase [Pedobacter sp. UYP24]
MRRRILGYVLLVTSFLLYSSLKSSAQIKKAHSLEFNVKRYELQTLSLDGKSIRVRAFEQIIYVENPVDTNYQTLNIYVPEAYFMGKDINGYTASTAPIFFPNDIGGYMPAKPVTASNNQSVLIALSRGYVVASAGARGRPTKGGDGLYNGKAPAAIVDLKAAIRYLKYNDKNIPGNAKRIISNGTSAGGAMSTLLGGTGDAKDYEPFLKLIGAAKGTDDVFAVSAYCPITNLDNSDTAYEWQFNSMDHNLSDQQIEVSRHLKALFPQYLNNLKLKNDKGQLLSLDKSGNGNFKDLVKRYVIASAQKALDKGADLKKLQWIKIEGTKVADLNFEAYIGYMERMKNPPAFDALDLSSPENQEFGTATVDKQHFTDFAVKNAKVHGNMADKLMVKMMNPMNYIGQKDIKIASHWRIRHGAKDRDTGLAVSVMMATLLQNKGIDTNFELPWDVPHSGDYDLDELFVWMDGICKGTR